MIVLDVVSFIMSGAALFLTLYFQYWQPGKLVIFNPSSYYPWVTPKTFGVNIVFTLYNEGARPIIIQDLRLVFSNNDHVPMAFLGIAEKIDALPDQRNKKPIVIEPKKSLPPLICSFEGPDEEGSALQELQLGTPEKRLHAPLKIEAKLGNNDKWNEVIQFTLTEAARVKDNWYI